MSAGEREPGFLWNLVLGYGNEGGAHIQYCLNRYRSYDPNSDTFMGYDGLRHPCNAY